MANPMIALFKAGGIHVYQRRGKEEQPEFQVIRRGIILSRHMTLSAAKAATLTEYNRIMPAHEVNDLLFGN